MLAAFALIGLLLLLVGGGGTSAAARTEASVDRVGRGGRREGDGGLEQFAAEMALALSSGCRPVEALRRCSRHRNGSAARRGLSAVVRIDRGMDPLAAFQAAAAAALSAPESALYAALAGELQNGSPAAPSVAALARTASNRARRREVERAARAAPLVQLVVALGLVPSALLIGGAVLLAGLQT
jgi:tight adherence protein C